MKSAAMVDVWCPSCAERVGVAAAAASIVSAGGRSSNVAYAVWLVLAARVVGAIPFVRVQVQRLRRGSAPVRQSDVAQVASVAVASAAALIDKQLIVGLIGIVGLALVQSVWVRVAPVPAKVLGLRQMALGLALVAVTATGVLLSNVGG